MSGGSDRRGEVGRSGFEQPPQDARRRGQHGYLITRMTGSGAANRDGLDRLTGVDQPGQYPSLLVVDVSSQMLPSVVIDGHGIGVELVVRLSRQADRRARAKVA